MEFISTPMKTEMMDALAHLIQVWYVNIDIRIITLLDCMVMVITTITRNLDDLFEDTGNTNRLWWNLLCSQLNHIVTSVTWSLFRPSYFIIIHLVTLVVLKVIGLDRFHCIIEHHCLYIILGYIVVTILLNLVNVVSGDCIIIL